MSDNKIKKALSKLLPQSREAIGAAAIILMGIGIPAHMAYVSYTSPRKLGQYVNEVENSLFHYGTRDNGRANSIIDSALRQYLVDYASGYTGEALTNKFEEKTKEFLNWVPAGDGSVAAYEGADFYLPAQKIYKSYTKNYAAPEAKARFIEIVKTQPYQAWEQAFAAANRPTHIPLVLER